jgi:riboflavin biosynthesis pyrimidine reductase
VEGGARLLTALLRARLADRLVVTIAPTILGAGIDAVGDLGIADLSQAIRLVDAQVTPYGVDLVLDARIAYPADAAPA